MKNQSNSLGCNFRGVCPPDTWPQTKIPRVAANPKARFTERKRPWDSPLSTIWATAPQPNICEHCEIKTRVNHSLKNHTILMCNIHVADYEESKWKKLFWPTLLTQSSFTSCWVTTCILTGDENSRLLFQTLKINKVFPFAQTLQVYSD